MPKSFDYSPAYSVGLFFIITPDPFFLYFQLSNYRTYNSQKMRKSFFIKIILHFSTTPKLVYLRVRILRTA